MIRATAKLDQIVHGNGGHDMEASVLRFLAFLGAELLFLLASAAGLYVVGMLILKTGEFKGRYILINALISTVVMMLFMALFLWILTGDGYTWFFLGILAVSIVLMGLVELLWLIFGEANVPWAERTIWHGHELEKLYPYVTKPVQLMALAVFVIYPIYIGIDFFGDTFDSDQWDGMVLRATLILFFGTGYLVLLPASLYVMVNHNIAEGTRSRIFINQLVHSVVFLMVVSFFVWTLEPNAEAVPLAGKLIAFTPHVLYVTVAYVVGLLVIPYLIGHFRYKAWKEKLDADRSRIIDDLLVKARSPLLDKAEDGLVQASADIDNYLPTLTEEKSYRLAEEAAHGNADNILYFRAAEKSIPRDPRFIHVGFLTGLREQIDDCLTALRNAADDKTKQALLENFVGTVGDQGQVNGTQGKTGRPWVLAGITAVVVAVTNPIVTAFGKTVATMFGLELE